MQSKNKPPMTAAERRHVAKVKMLPCAVCSAGGGESSPSEAHEIEQGKWFLSVALCAECHRGTLLGLHGQKRAWAIRKMSELDALAVTIEAIV